MNLRRKTFLAPFAALLLLGIAAPTAGAASASITDPGNDVASFDTGAPASDPRVDVTKVELRNDPDEVELDITVAQTVPFSDPVWANDDLGVIGVIDDAATDDDSGTYVWSVLVINGQALGLLSNGGSSTCVTFASQTATSYTLRADESCSRGLPRSLEYGAVALAVSNGGEVADFAPDDQCCAAAVEAAAQGIVSRVAGTDRTLTAIELSKASFDSEQADAVVLAAAQSFPDALAGGPLAFGVHGPLLLTGQTGLDARTKTEMQRVLGQGGDVYVLGGTAALSDQVVTDVRAAGFTATRVAGVNRFETAVAIADEFDQGPIDHQEVLVADGRTFTDALIAGADAPGLGAVVVLTDGGTMPAATQGYLSSDTTTHVAIGTPAAQAAPGLHAITGTDPSDLSAKVAAELHPIGGIVAVANLKTFADALAGGPFIAHFGGPLLLTDPATLSPAAKTAIGSAAGSLREVVIFGGTAAVAPAVEQAIAAELGT